MSRRWTEMLDHLANALPSGAVCVVVDGPDGHTADLADRLAATLRGVGRPCARLAEASPNADEHVWLAERTPEMVALADGQRWRVNPPCGQWDVVIWLRTLADDSDRGHDADVVIDLHDPGWPVIRHVDARLGRHDRWYRTETQAFFAAKASGWDAKFGDDVPAYTVAIADAGLAPGAVVVDVGCGTGRALPVLRDAVGPTGVVVGLDLTPQMLAVAHDLGRAAAATLVVADASQLPLADSSVDAVFAAGLLMHLPDPVDGMRELARVTRTGGRLVLFHPSGRAALAARHGRVVRPDEPLSEGPLRSAAERTGWELVRYDDAAHRFLALATRC
jgi:SAM-dependent methyltransferase